jgi:signal transduction histidine kinase
VKRALSIKTRISLLVLVLGMLLICLDGFRNDRLLRHRTLARLEREAQTSGARLAGLMQHCFRNAQPRVAELELSYAALAHDFELALVLDSGGVVRFASQLQWRGLPFDECPLAPYVQPELLAAAGSDGLAARHGGRMLALYPFSTSYETAETGLVVLSYDATRALLRARGEALRESVGRACSFASVCLLLWLALDWLVTRRVDRLVDYAKSVREGLRVPNPERRMDEFGAIATTFEDSVERLRQTEARLLDASESERRRIGRDIHDDVCQRIAAAQLKCGVLGRLLEREGLPHADTAGAISRELQEAVVLTRGFAHGLCPVRIGTEGLTAALADLGMTLGRSFGVDCEVSADLGGIELPPLVETHVFRIVQELMVNAAKHAEPSRINATVSLRGDSLEIVVENDGRSFESQSGGPGLGLRFVEQRVRAIDGRLQFLSPAQGVGGTRAVCLARLPPDALTPTPRTEAPS